MKNRCVRIIKFFSLLFVTCCFLWVLRSDFRIIGIDPQWSYMQQIDSGEVHAWHSVLFIYEAILFKNVISFFVPCDAERILRIMWFLAGGGIWFSIMAMCYRFISHKFCYCISVFLFGLLLLVLYKFRYTFFFYYIDYFFLCWLLLCITSIIYINGKNRKFWSLLFVLSALHVALYRANAIVLIPVLSYWFIHSFSKLCSFRLRAGLAATLTVLLLGCSCFVKEVLPARKCSPTAVLIASELRNKSLLVGEIEKELTNLRRSDMQYWYQIDTPYNNAFFSDYGMTYLHGPTYPFPEDKWSNLIERYKDNWVNCTEEMLTVRCILTTQFFTNGYTPVWLRKIIEEKYPEVRKNIHSWTFEPDYFAETGRERPFIYLIFLFVMMYLFLTANSLKKRGMESGVIPVLLGLGSVAIVYTTSFLILIPSPDNRYHAPSMYIIAFVLSIVSVHIFCGQRKTLS